jgi:uncharacterized membrane protein
MYYIDLGAATQSLYTTAFKGLLLQENYDALNQLGGGAAGLIGISHLTSGSYYFGSYLGIHFSPFLFLLVPIFAVAPSPLTLLTIKSFAIGLSIVPAYLLAKDVIKSRLPFLIALVAYVANPALLNLAFADFQAQAFFPLPWLAAVYFYRKQRLGLYYPLLILSLSTNEFMCVLIAFYALVELALRKFRLTEKTRPMLLTLVSATLWYAFAFFAVMPLFKPHILGPWNAALGGNIFGAFSFDLAQKMFFWFLCLAPFAFQPLLSPYIVALIPWAGVTLLATSPADYEFGWHLGAYFVPFLFLAFVDVQARFSSLFKAKTFGLILVLILSVSMMFSPLNPLNTNVIPGIAYAPVPYDQNHINLIHQVAELVPPDASILVQTPISQIFAARTNSYIAVPSLAAVRIDYILADSKHWDFKYFEFDRIVSDAINNGSYGILAYADGIILLKKGYTGTPVLYMPYDEAFSISGQVKGVPMAGNLALGEATTIFDPSAASGRVAYANGIYQEAGVVWYGPYTTLLPGSYNVTVVLKVVDAKNFTQGAHMLTVQVTADRGQTILATHHVLVPDAQNMGKFFNVTFSFSLSRAVPDIEIRGVFLENCSIELDYIRLLQTQ